MARLNNILLLVIFIAIVCAIIWTSLVVGTEELSDEYAPAPAPFPEECTISSFCAGTLAGLIVGRTLPSKRDNDCCREVIHATRYCWDATIKMIEDPEEPIVSNLHPWAEDTWNKCVSLTSSKVINN